MTGERTGTATPALDRITEVGLGFTGAKILLTALELGVFTALADGPRTEPELRAALGLHGRGCADFLNALVALGFLERDGGRYGNGAPATPHLVRGAGYSAGFLDGANFVLYPAWGGLSAALRSGAPQAAGDFEAMLADPERQRVYLSMMDSLSGPLAPEVAGALDWRAHATVADVGGARGNMVGLLLREHRHLAGVVFDRPQNAAACAEHTAALGAADRVRFHGGDFFVDDLPEADVVVIGHVLADFSVKQRESLVRKAYRAVRPGGALVVYDPMPDPGRPDLAGLVASLHMLVMTPAGAGYPPDDCVRWMERAGFVEASVCPLALGNTLVIGRKAG
jgi:SAM-dependent methyltransferase